MWINTIVVLLLLMIVHQSFQHGKMIVPPARNAAWRYGFKTPINYNDNELFCGGLTTMFKKNHGKCGICGDSFSQTPPRLYETGGKDYTGIITKTYKSGEIINAEILITSNHRGHFIFSLCPRNDPNIYEAEECFIELQRYKLPSKNVGIFTVPIKLPLITCSHCVLRWHWRGANNWGICPDGKGRLGCGPQETFRNCADISIRGVNENDDDNDDPSINQIDDYDPNQSELKKLHDKNKKINKIRQTETSQEEKTSILTNSTTISTNSNKIITKANSDQSNDDDDDDENDEDNNFIKTLITFFKIFA